jgi:uncharacterized repeat protein (TIGR01451 family)
MKFLVEITKVIQFLRGVSVRIRFATAICFLTFVWLFTSSVFAMAESDLSVAVMSDSVVVPLNTNFTYTVTVQNLGGDDATFVSITDNLPSGIVFLTSDDCSVSGSIISCNIGNLPATESRVVSYEVRATLAGTALNSVSVSGAETDPNLSNNTTSRSVDIVVPDPVDLSLSGSVLPTEVNLSDLVDLNFSVTNNGLSPSYLTGIEFILPSQLEFVSSGTCSNAAAVISCQMGILDAGSISNLSVSVRAIAAGNPVNVSALVSHFDSDPDASNNGTSISVVVNEPPPDSVDLQNGVVTSVSQYTVGVPVDFTFTIINSGPSNATEVRIISDLPDGLSFVSSSDCAMAGDLLVCDVGDLVLNAIYTGTVRVQSTVISPSLTLSASVVGNETDPNAINNVASITLASVDPIQPTATITDTPIATTTPLILTATPGPTQTPFQVIVTQPVFLTEPSSFNNSDRDDPLGGLTLTDLDILPDGVAPSEIYGWTRHESIDLIPVTGRWALRAMQNASDGAYHESRDSGAMLRFPFEGDGFRIGYRSEVHGGSFQVLLDGKFLAIYGTDVNDIDPELNPSRQTFLTQPHWVVPGYHVVDIVCLSDGQGAQGCNIDYIEIFIGPPIPVAPAVVVVPTQAEMVENVELITAPPTLAPTSTPASDSVISVDVFVNVDLNTNRQIEPNEGVSDISVQAIDVSNNTTLATVMTDESGFVRISVATTGDIVLLIPMLGESFYVRNRGSDLLETWNLVLNPATVPGLIP